MYLNQAQYAKIIHPTISTWVLSFYNWQTRAPSLSALGPLSWQLFYHKSSSAIVFCVCTAIFWRKSYGDSPGPWETCVMIYIKVRHRPLRSYMDRYKHFGNYHINTTFQELRVTSMICTAIGTKWKLCNYSFSKSSIFS